MNILSTLNSGTMYLICGAIVLFVALVCVLFAVRAYRAGLLYREQPFMISFGDLIVQGIIDAYFIEDPSVFSENFASSNCPSQRAML